MKDILAAERYARALFEVARIVHRDVEIQEDLHSFSAALKRSPQIMKFLESPRLGAGDKEKILGKIYGDHDHEARKILLNFFSVLMQKNRFYLIHEIDDNFKRITDAERGIGLAEIRSASPLDAESEKTIVSRLERLAGYKIEVKKELDPSLIGGVVVKIRNKVLDGSVKHQLGLLKKELTKIRSI